MHWPGVSRAVVCPGRRNWNMAGSSPPGSGEIADWVPSHDLEPALSQRESKLVWRTADPSRTTYTFHFHRVFHGSVGVLFVAFGAGGLVLPVVSLFTGGWYRSVSSPRTAGEATLALLASVGFGLLFAWMGIRQFRYGAQVSGQKLTIRNTFRTYTVDAADIRAITATLVRRI